VSAAEAEAARGSDTSAGEVDDDSEGDQNHAPEPADHEDET
jgi:hypothetical protein